MPTTTILIVEDEVHIRDMIRLALELEKFKVIEAGCANEAQHLIANKIPDLILLDWMLPGTSGFDFTKRLKTNKLTQNIPIILLTAKAEENSKVKGLDAGADDYITKPFSPRELIARIKTVLRRGPFITPDNSLEIAGIFFDINTEEVRIHNQTVSLTALEYRLLYFFMKHPSRVYSREELLNHIWGGNTEINDRTVDVQIRRLRRVLAKFGRDGYIQTVRGSGYRFSP